MNRPAKQHDSDLDQLVGTMTAQCLAHRLRLMHRVVTGIYDDALRSVGVNMKVSQMNILVIVVQIGPVKPVELCKRMKIDASTLSRNVERMRGQGWLETLAGDDDRSHLLAATAKGRLLVRKGAVGWRKAQKKTMALMGKDGVQAIHRLADRMHGGKEAVM